MELSCSLLILSTFAYKILGIEGFLAQYDQRTRWGALYAIDLSTIDQLAQIDPSAIQSQVSTALPDLLQIIDSDGVMMQAEKFSTVLANNAAVVNGCIGVGSFFLGSAVTGKANAEDIEGLKKSVADKESTLQELQSKLEEAQTSEKDLNIKTTQYEDQLFDLETKFEKETGTIKQNFQETLEKEKDKMRKKTKAEMKFTMDLKMKQERSKMVQEKLEFLNEMSFEKNRELSKLRLQNVEMQQTQKKTEAVLQQSQDELEKLNSLKNKKAFWPTEMVGLRMKQADSEKKIDRLTKEVEDMEDALVQAKEEIEAVNSRKNFFSFITKTASKDTTEK